MVQTMMFLDMKPSPLPVLIPLGPRNLFSNTLSLRPSLNVRDHASQPCSTTGNTQINQNKTHKLTHGDLSQSEENKCILGFQENNLNLNRDLNSDLQISSSKFSFEI